MPRLRRADHLRAESDVNLARALVAGEPWAVTETWRRFAPMVLTTARRRLGSQQEAEDAAQEAFIRLFRTVKRLRTPDCLRSFVYSVTVRTIRDQLRAQRDPLASVDVDSLVDPRNLVGDLESRERLRRVRRLLQQLSKRHLSVLTLRRVEVMTIPQIALATGISGSTVKRSLRKLDGRLSAWRRAENSRES